MKRHRRQPSSAGTVVCARCGREIGKRGFTSHMDAHSRQAMAALNPQVGDWLWWRPDGHSRLKNTVRLVRVRSVRSMGVDVQDAEQVEYERASQGKSWGAHNASPLHLSREHPDTFVPATAPM